MFTITTAMVIKLITLIKSCSTFHDKLTKLDSTFQQISDINPSAINDIIIHVKQKFDVSFSKIEKAVRQRSYTCY